MYSSTDVESFTNIMLVYLLQRHPLSVNRCHVTASADRHLRAFCRPGAHRALVRWSLYRNDLGA